MSSPRWALFLSGRGSTAQVVLEQLNARFHVQIVVSSRGDTPGISRARRTGLVRHCFVHRDWSLAGWEQLLTQLQNAQVERVLLLGFMRRVPAFFVQAFRRQIFNIHPSLLPQFAGAQGLERSFADVQAQLGVTLHEVDEGLDTGTILHQTKAPRVCNWDLQKSIVAMAEKRLLQRFLTQESSIRWQGVVQ